MVRCGVELKKPLLSVATTSVKSSGKHSPTTSAKGHKVTISDEAIEAAAEVFNRYVGVHDTYATKAILEAAALPLMAPILALCDAADGRRGSSMYCKLTTYEVRKVLGVEE